MKYLRAVRYTGTYRCRFVRQQSKYDCSCVCNCVFNFSAFPIFISIPVVFPELCYLNI